MDSELKFKLKNISSGKKYIGECLKKYKDNDIVDNTDILNLLQYHPTKHIIIENIEYLKIKNRPPFNKLALYYKYKNSEIEDDISYVLCITNLFGKYKKDVHYKNDVMTAFRNESHIGTKKQFFVKNTNVENNFFFGICDHCKIETNNITTDHYNNSYKSIFNKFIESEKIILEDVEIFENECNEIRLKNNDLALKWRKFHDENAIYRLLCKPCNSRFGSYEQK